MRLPALLFGLMVATCLALPAHAQWKWKDARGQVHVSDTPPPREVLDKDILQRPAAPVKRAPAAAASGPPTSAAGPATTASAPSDAATGKARPTTDPELEARKAKAEAEQKYKAKADEERLAAQRAENCQRARQQVAALQSGQRIARVNAGGERVILDDQARASEMSAAQRVVSSDCR